MGNLNSTQALILLLLNLGTLLISLACPDCAFLTPPSKSPNLPPKYPPKVKPLVAKPPPTVPKPPPHVPKPPTVKSPHLSKRTLYFSWDYHYANPYDKPPTTHPPRLPRRPFVHPPPIKPELPIFETIPKPSIVYPPIIPTPPITPAPPVITPSHLLPVVPQPLPETPSPPFPPQETLPPPKTCPTLKLDECVDELGNLAYIGIGNKAKDTCCLMLAGLLDLDAAHCLCTTIKAKLLNINIVIPIALQVLVDCGKTPPSSFQCTA